MADNSVVSGKAAANSNHEGGGEKRKHKKPSDKDLDLNNADRGVWLVKVPKYIADRWESSAEGSDLGKLRIARRPNQKPMVSFTLSDQVAAARTKAQEHKVSEGQVMPIGRTNKEVPKEHKFMVQSVAAQSLAVFSHTSSAKPAAAAGAAGDEDKPKEPLLAPGPDKLALEGKVVQRAECRPISDGLYMSLKREAIVRAIEPARKTKQLDKAVAAYKPKSNHQANIQWELQKKLEGKKSRDDREKVLERLFALFEKHQYYNIKDLVKETRQPVTYLKEILKEVCNYNLKNPHKNMWELKPEYRHYKAEEKPAEEEEKDSSDDD